MQRDMVAADYARLLEGKERRRRADALPQSMFLRDHRAEWCGFLSRFPLDSFFTCTFSDEYAAAHSVYSLTSALNNFERWVEEIAYPGQYFVAAEWHSERDVPHLHGLLDASAFLPYLALECDLPVPEDWQPFVLRQLWCRWYATRGRARFEVPKGGSAVTYYCTKYALKEADADTVRFRLWKQTRRERAADRGGVRIPVGEGSVC